MHTQAAGSLCALLTITHPQADCGPHTWLPCIPRGDVSCSWSHPCLPSTGCHILEEVERAPFFSQSSAGTHPWSAHICSPNSIQKPKGFLFPTDLTQYYQTHNSISSSYLKRTLWRAMHTPTSPGSSSGPAPVRGQARVLCGRASLAPVPSGHLPALKVTTPSHALYISSASHHPKTKAMRPNRGTESFSQCHGPLHDFLHLGLSSPKRGLHSRVGTCYSRTEDGSAGDREPYKRAGGRHSGRESTGRGGSRCALGGALGAQGPLRQAHSRSPWGRLSRAGGGLRGAHEAGRSVDRPAGAVGHRHSSPSLYHEPYSCF